MKMFLDEKKQRYILYSFYFILTACLLIGAYSANTSYRIILFAIYITASAIGRYITRDIISIETINQDLNPYQIIKTRREKKIVQLEEQKEDLLQELYEKQHTLQEIVETVSTKFEKKRDTILQAVNEFERYTKRDAYFSKKDHHRWHKKWHHTESVFELYLSLQGIPLTYEPEIKKLYDYLQNGESIITKRNQTYVKQQLEVHNNYFETLEKYPLTQKQREAIIIDEHRNLVLAGAGTGKTSTVIGKTGFLLRKEAVKPEEILLLSFGRDPRNEMVTRLKERFEATLDVNTFHSLGMKIIAEAKDEKPSISVLSTDQIKLQQFIGQIIEQNLGDTEFIGNLNKFFLSQTEYTSLWEFKTLGEYHSHMRSNQVRSLKGDQVKSYEELELANWLYLNGVEYEYEKPYEHRTVSKLYGQYKPDFYLTEYGIYLEHFGVDRNGNTAPCVPKARYLAGMTWKREIHRQHETKLIETYSYERMEGNLLENLQTKLNDHGVQLDPISQDQIFNKLNEMGIVKPIYGLLATFLTLYKSTITDIPALRAKANESDQPGRELAFLEVFTRIEQAYENHLTEHNEIDFNDMIQDATQYLSNGIVQTGYKYVLVDEFQDISQSRNRLLTALINQNPYCKLFAVGDDWQSIYRFTGSDLNIMTNFEEYHPYSISLLLDETFRFNNQLGELSTKFILENPNQIPKQLVSNNESKDPAVTVIHTENPKAELTKLLSELNESKGSVFILGRYNRDNPRVKKYYGNLIVEFLTAHKSKGTEADLVIIVGLQAGRMGFPCQIVDDPVLNLVLSKKDSVPHSEERRLFYVALTRAKKHVYLISNNHNVSDFVKEITNGDYLIEKRDVERSDNPKCPRCETGNIVSRFSERGRFYACSNYPYCGYIAPWCPKCRKGHMMKKGTINVCSECRHRAISCPECKEGIRVLRNGRYSEFYGCSNYPDCRYTYSQRGRREPFYVS